MQDALHTLAGRVLAHLGEALLACDPLARGAGCDVWRVRSDRADYALRVFHAAARGPDGAIDAHLRRAVHERGGSVVAPVLWSEACAWARDGPRWCLDPFIPGTHPERGALPLAVCEQLGATLAALHQVPAEGFGRPVRVEGACLIGGATSPVEGAAQRFDLPSAGLSQIAADHPVIEALPALQGRLRDCLQEVEAIAGRGQAVPCHSDLHEKQLICAGGALRALIDFDEVAMLDRHWDLGSFYYFHGEANYRALHAAYTATLDAEMAELAQAKAFSVAVALHHANRARLPGKAHRLPRAIAHIQHVLSG